MWHPRGGRKASDLAWKQSQAALLGRFFTRFEQSLQPETNAEKWNARADTFQQRLAHLHLIQGPHHLSKVADTRQNDFRRAAERTGIANQFVLGSNLCQSILHRPQIPRAVIENRDHNSPLVEGSCSFSRASLEHAYRSARAKHLKIASIL